MQQDVKDLDFCAVSNNSNLSTLDINRGNIIVQVLADIGALW